MMESSSNESPGGVDGSIRGGDQRDSDAGLQEDRGGVEVGISGWNGGWMMGLEEDVGGVDESREVEEKKTDPQRLGGGEDNVSIGGMKVGFVDWESRVEYVDGMNGLDLCMKYKMMVSM